MSALLSFPPGAFAEAPSNVMELPEALLRPTSNFLSVRGVRLEIAELVDRSLFTPEKIESLRARLLDGKPFPHLVVEGIFNPRLLELVLEEFDDLPGASWADIKSRYESTRRSVLGARLGPASQLYFDILNSGWFTEWLSGITGTPYLLPDPKLFGGGLHESRTGATFAVHRDFDRHRHNGLKNEMVVITYLNKGWQPEWGSALELWDKAQDRCVTTVQPEFGHTIILPHGKSSFHGHTVPLATPDGRPRRSVAAYFYTSPVAGKQSGDESASLFMHTHRVDRIKAVARGLTPPLAWTLVKKLTGR